LENVEVDLAEIKEIADFKFVKIVDEMDPYPSLLRIE